MVFLAVWVVRAFAAEEVREAEGNASGVVDGFHAREDRLADLTLQLFFDDVADTLQTSQEFHAPIPKPSMIMQKRM